MDWLSFVASLVSSLAWPVAAAIVVLVFKDQIKRMLERLPKRVKAGPVEVEWPEVATEARVALATSPEVREAGLPGSLTERFAKMAEEEPKAAVMAAWAEVEKALRDRLSAMHIASEPSVGGGMLGRFALERGVIRDPTLQAIDGLAHLRILAAYGRPV